MSVALTCLAGMLFAVNATFTRLALDRTRIRTDVAAVATVVTAATVASVIAIIGGVRLSDLSWADSKGFFVIGIIVPGVAQLTFYAAIRMAGPSRSAIMLGTVPVWSVVLAIIFLDEHWSATVVVGTLLAVAGSILLATEGITKASVSRLGLLLAALTALQFAIRDVLARSVTQESNLDSSTAAAVTLGVGAVVLIGVAVGTAGPREFSENLRRSMPAMLIPGVAVGLAMPALLAAFERSRVGIVSPILGTTQTVGAVLLSGLLIGGTEINKRVVLAVSVTLAGGTLIGITR
jgi:drug/metabolite transporter (DMT)-like permease|tara:strand:- start:3005 stop:3880 length:876 start_codon:yes stop_codon:yes gene_type:complete